MPWENRFETRTFTQCNAYRQLIGKEWMQRRNAEVRMRNYQFRDELSGAAAPAEHWTGDVIDTTTGRLSPVHEAAAYNPKQAALQRARPASAAPVLQGKRALLHVQSRSSVLDEGVPLKTQLVPTGAAEFNSANSITSKRYTSLNPEAAAPRTLSRVKHENMLRAEAISLERRAARLAKQRGEDPALAVAGVQLARDPAVDPCAPAAADEPPRTTTPPHPSDVPRFGLRSEGTRRPLTPGARAKLRDIGKSVFDRPPLPAHVADARKKRADAAAEAQRAAEDLFFRRGMAPAAGAGAVEPLAVQRRPASAVPSSRASVASRGSSRLSSAAHNAAVAEKLDNLEAMVDEDRTLRDNIRTSIADLCTLVESATQAADAAPGTQPAQKKPGLEGSALHNKGLLRRPKTAAPRVKCR